MKNENNEVMINKDPSAAKRMKKKKVKKIIKTAVTVLIILAICVFLFFRSGYANKMFGKDDAAQQKLTTYTVSQRTITKVLTSTGTIEPNDQYTIGALVSGEILADHFSEGDTVAEDQLLYEIDSDNLNSSVTRARNSLKNATTALDDAREKLVDLDVKSKITGTIEKIYVEVGDDIGVNQVIADVVDSETMCIDIPFMDFDCSGFSVGSTANITFETSYEEALGVVTEISPTTSVNDLGVTTRLITISVKNTGSITPETSAFANIGDAVCTASAKFYYNDEGQIVAKSSGEVEYLYFAEGDRIRDGQIIAHLENTSLENQIENLENNVEDAESALEDALDAYENYNITSPISGKVISKSYKAGDTISGGGNSSNQLAVIYDMSALKFTMSIDELDIDSIDEGQEVIITCDSREGEKYYGTISNISIQGTTSNGTTVYPIEVTIENTEIEDKRTISDDGTVSKVYNTGMTSTTVTTALSSAEKTDGGTLYRYENGTEILVKPTSDGVNELFAGDKKLNAYIDGTYTQSSNFYSFSQDFGILTLEVQNDKKMLRPGMNIDAEIIVENRENVIAVPLAAVGRGNVVKVIKQAEKQVSEENADSIQTPNVMSGEISDNTTQQRPQTALRGSYGSADAGTEYEQVQVSVGISDDDYVEITSGLKVGDVVIVDNSNLALDNMNNAYGMMGMGGMGQMGGFGGGMPSGGFGGGMPSGGMQAGGRMGR